MPAGSAFLALRPDIYVNWLRKSSRVKAVEKQRRQDPGFDPKGVLTFALSPPKATYSNGAAVEAYYRELRRKLAAVPGVQAVAATNFNAPLDIGTGSLNITPEAATTGAHELELAGFRLLTPGYFSALRIRVLAGRDFDEADIEGEKPIAIVNRTFAQRYWPGEDAVGKAFRIGGTERISIIGVVDDVREEGLHQEVRPAVCIVRIWPLTACTQVWHLSYSVWSILALRRSPKSVTGSRP